MRKYLVNIKADEAGYYIVTVPDLSGCVSDGKVREEALENVEEAIKGYIETLKKHNEPVPEPQDYAEVEVKV